MNKTQFDVAKKELTALSKTIDSSLWDAGRIVADCKIGKAYKKIGGFERLDQFIEACNLGNSLRAVQYACKFIEIGRKLGLQSEVKTHKFSILREISRLKIADHKDHMVRLIKAKKWTLEAIKAEVDGILGVSKDDGDAEGNEGDGAENDVQGTDEFLAQFNSAYQTAKTEGTVEEFRARVLAIIMAQRTQQKAA